MLQYWVPREKINPGVWIAVASLVITLVNLFRVRLFGKIEFWLSSFKVAVVLGVIFLCMILASGGGPNHDATVFRYWQDPGAFNHFIKS